MPRKRKTAGGRKPLPKEQHRVLTTIRMNPRLYADLEQECSRSHRSLTREIEARLKRSFRDQFGESPDRDLAFITVELARRIRTVTTKSWIEDRYTFDAFKVALLWVLEFLEPEGEPAVPDGLQKLAEISPPAFGSIVRSADAFGLAIGAGLWGGLTQPPEFDGSDHAKFQKLREKLKVADRKSAAEVSARLEGLYKRLGLELMSEGEQ